MAEPRVHVLLFETATGYALFTVNSKVLLLPPAKLDPNTLGDITTMCVFII